MGVRGKEATLGISVGKAMGQKGKPEGKSDMRNDNGVRK